METEGGERLYRAPNNAVSAPPRRETEGPAGSVSVPVLARLVWGREVQVVPAQVLRWTRGVVLVEWWPDPRRDRVRSTWLRRDDVRRELRYRL